SGNTADQGRQVYVLGDGTSASATLNNSILAQSDSNVTDFVAGTINGGTASTAGSNNLLGVQVGFTGGFQSLDPSLAVAVFSDPGFETHSVGAGSYAYDPTGSPWTFSGKTDNGSGLASNGSAFNNPSAPEGSQVAFLQATGSISQVINLDAGTY